MRFGKSGRRMEINSKRLLIENTVRLRETIKKTTTVTMANLTPDDKDAKRRTITISILIYT